MIPKIRQENEFDRTILLNHSEPLERIYNKMMCRAFWNKRYLITKEIGSCRVRGKGLITMSLIFSNDYDNKPGRAD